MNRYKFCKNVIRILEEISDKLAKLAIIVQTCKILVCVVGKNFGRILQNLRIPKTREWILNLSEVAHHRSFILLK